MDVIIKHLIKINLKNNVIENDLEHSTYVEDLDDPLDFVRIFHHYNDNLLPHPKTSIDLNNYQVSL